MSLELGFRYGTRVLPDALLQFSALKILHNPSFFSFKRVQVSLCLIGAEYPSNGTPMDKVSKDAKIRNRYNQVPHLTKDTNGKVTNLQRDTTN